MSSPLDQIRALIEANELSLARDRLKKFLEDNPENAQGWFLASFVQPTPEMRLASIKQAAKLRPNQQEIQQRFMKLESAVGKRKSAIPLPAIALFVFALAIGLVAVSLSRNTLDAPNEQLPTLAVLGGVTEVAQQQTKATATVVPVLQSEVTVTTLPATDVSSPVEPTVQTTEVPVVASTPILGSTLVFAASQPTNLVPQPTVLTNATALIVPTTVSDNPTVTPALSMQPTLTQPTAMPAQLPVLPLASPVNIGIGEFRVVDAKRGAESVIQELGGSFPPAPANQSWVLLELLLFCKSSPTCTIDPATLQVTGSAGVIHAYSSDLNLPPTFGTTTVDNQVWGYLGFVVPTNETGLKLTLSENGQTYAVALE
jgi:hypothetical protein